MCTRSLALAAVFTLIAATVARPDEIDDLVNAEIARQHIPGLSLAVVRDGHVAKSAAYGLANVELNVPATTASVFQIQSMTKQFTATAVMMLVEEGKLSVDDPLSKHLDNTPDAWKGVTLRHLLTHTSGIKDFINEPTADLRLDVTEEDVFKATTPRPLNFQPGDKFAYSNTNYHLLAMVIRKITAKPYGEFLRERIFQPLGMNDTRIVRLSTLIPNRVSGYQWRNNTRLNGAYVAESILAYAGGGICSTALDLAKWDAALYTDKLVKRSTLEQMWTPAKLNDGSETAAGFGWFITRVRGHRHIAHGGGHITGFTSYISRFPEDRLTVIVLCNSGGGNTGKIARQVAGLINPALAPDKYEPIEDKEPQVAQLLRDLISKARDGKLVPEPFAPELWAAIGANPKAVQAMAAALGELKSLTLVQRVEQNGVRRYRYRGLFQNASLMVLISINKDGKVAEFTGEPE